MRAVYLVLGLLILLLTINFLDKCEEGKFLRFAGKDYCVPRESSIYMSGVGFFNALFLPLSGQLDSDKNQEIFVVPIGNLKSAIPEVKDRTTKNGSIYPHIQALVFAISKQELPKFYLTSTAIIDIVLGLGEWSEVFKDPKVSTIPFTDWIRITQGSYLDGASKGSWYVFKKYPELTDGSSSNPGNFVATCMSQGSKIYPLETVCGTSYVDEEQGFYIKFRLTEDSLYLKDQVGAYLVKQISSWELKESEKN